MKALAFNLRWYLWEKWELRFYRTFPAFCDHQNQGRMYSVTTGGPLFEEPTYVGHIDKCARCWTTLMSKSRELVADQMVLVDHLK